MNPVAYLEFEETASAGGAITKFGGKPWGLRQEDWPTSAKGGQPLEFLLKSYLSHVCFPEPAMSLLTFFGIPEHSVTTTESC